MANPTTGKATIVAREKTNLFIYDNFQEDNSEKATFNDNRHYKIYFQETIKRCAGKPPSLFLYGNLFLQGYKMADLRYDPSVSSFL